MRVVFLTAVLPQYRVQFHERVRDRLAASGTRYELVYGQSNPNEAAKGTDAHITWGKRVFNHYVDVGRTSLVWQPALRDIWNCDLAIVGQESRFLINYLAQAAHGLRRSKLALWGHGRNFQLEDTRQLAVHWKRFWATRCDWWFAYTEQTRKIVEGYGFPAERITVFHNSIDTSDLQRLAAEITEDDLAELRRRYRIATTNVGVYVGGIYNHKRINFLIQSAVEIRRRIPDFAFIVIGSGDERGRLEAAVRSYPWIQYLGPRFGREKVEILRLGRVFMMPGLVGLAVLDCAAAGIPIVTTAYPYHSPEIEYLRAGGNGLIVDDWRSVEAYAEAVVSVLQDTGLRARLREAGRPIARRYTLDRMVDSFCEGVSQALAN
jgi:glycosyltransferase involved in cell wall biosynthesis